MRILAIETSCDETAAAVVEDGRRILSNVVSTQAAIHAPYGGVVPELASRHHIENIVPGGRQGDGRTPASTSATLDAVAVTQGPGLIGSLLVGVQAAKGIAFVHGKPLVPVHHIAGHIQAPFLAATDEIPLPALALVVSGGHTHLFEVPEPGDYRLLGPHARRRGRRGVRQGRQAARPRLSRRPGHRPARRRAPTTARSSSRSRASRTAAADFSFSGLKTAVLYHVRREGHPAGGRPGADVPQRGPRPGGVVPARGGDGAAAALPQRGRRAARPRSLLLTGGVAANTLLRREAARWPSELGLPLYVPPIALSTDNAAMIGAAGVRAASSGAIRAGWDLNAEPHLALGWPTGWSRDARTAAVDSRVTGYDRLTVRTSCWRSGGTGGSCGP